MEFYFRLQFQRLLRWIKEIGANPYLGLMIVVVLFIAASKYLFFETIYAVYLYPIIAASFLLTLNNVDRLKQLKLLFHGSKWRQIRLIENWIIGFPFIAYLLYENQWIVAGLMAILISILIFIPLASIQLKAFFTPFKRFPFEYIVGFRKRFYWFLIIGFILYQAIQVQNLNLAMACCGAVYLVCHTFLLEPENVFFVWNYNQSPNEFLLQKMKVSAVCSTILYVPFALLTICFFSQHWWVILLLFFAGNLVLCFSILSKYAAFPHIINLPQLLLVGLSLTFPPVFPFAAYFFYRKSIHNLKTILQ